MSDILEKWRIRCPLDHSSFEKFVNCDCNYGNARDVWWFKEQQIKKLQEHNKELMELLKEADSVIDDYLNWRNEKRMDYFDTRAAKLREALAKVEE